MNDDDTIQTIQEQHIRTKVIDGWDIGEKLCEALGLDTRLVTGLTIDIHARKDEIGAMTAYVTVEMLPTQEVLDLDWGKLLADDSDLR